MKLFKGLTLFLLVCFLGTLPATSLADAQYSYSYERYYVNGVPGKGLVAFKGSDLYLQVNDYFSQATGIVLTHSGDSYTLTKGDITLQAKLTEKAYTVNGVKRWGNTAPLLREEGQIYMGCALLSPFGILSSWDFGESALYLTTNGLPPYKNSYQLSDITANTAVAKNTVTNETIAIRLAGIRTTESLAQDFYQTNGTIATLAFDPMGADADGRAYAYVWLGDTLLNQLMLDKGLAQIDAAFAQSPSPYFEQLSASNEQSKQPHSTAP